MDSETFTLPHSLTAERAVFGAVLIDPDTFVHASDVIAGGDFYRDAHRRVWAAFETLNARAERIDILTLSHALAATGDLDSVGGLLYLQGLTDGVPRSTNVAHYARIVRERSISRDIITASHATIAQALDGAASGEVVASAMESLTRASTRAFSRGWLDPMQQADALDALLKFKAGQRVPMGLWSIDRDVSGGVQAGEVCGVLARPGIGKTLILCQTIVRALDEPGVGVCVFSLEMPAAQIVERVARMMFNVSKDALRSSWANLRADYVARVQARLIVTDAPGLSVTDMQSRVSVARRLALKGCSFVLTIIDHLGLIGGDDALRTYDRVSKQAREIKELAKSTSTGVLLAVQVSRESGGDGSKRLALGAARDSGVIEEALDYLLAVRRLDRSTTLPSHERDKFRNVLFMEWIKNRHGDVTGIEHAYSIHPVGLMLSEVDVDAPVTAQMAGVFK